MREEGRPKIQSTKVRSQPNIFVPQQADPLDTTNETAREPDRRAVSKTSVALSCVCFGNEKSPSGDGNPSEEGILGHG